MGGEDVADGPSRAKRGLARGERLAAGAEHVAVPCIDTTRHDHVHEARVVVAIGGSELERHLITPADGSVARVVADQQRLAAASHRPPARRRVAVAGED